MSRGERVTRLLTMRLEELARALERSGAASEPVAHLLELVSVATMHAVALEFLSPDEAEGIWQEARERHPVLAEIEPHLPVAA